MHKNWSRWPWGALCLLALGACEGPLSGPTSLVLPGTEGLASPNPVGKLPAPPDASEEADAPSPTEPPLGPAPTTDGPPPKATAPSQPTPTPQRASPAPTPAPQRVIALTPLAQVAQGHAPLYPVPPGSRGTLTLSQPGHVPLTYELPQPAPAHLHLTPADQHPSKGGQWLLEGQISPPRAGVLLSLAREGQAPLALGRTDAQGHFSLQAFAEGRQEAILVATSPDNLPTLALKRLSLAPEGGEQRGLSLRMEQAVSGYRLQAYLDFGPGPIPSPPVGMDLTGGLVVAAEAGPPAWRADLFSLPPGLLGGYRMGDFALGRLERARSPAGDEWSEVASSLETGFPPFMDPPLLTEVARPVPGGRVAWPPVSGAANYRLRLRSGDGSHRLLWEAAVRRASAPVPADAPAFEGPLELEVEALQAAGASSYDLASSGPKALRLGEGLPSPTGRRSWSIKLFP